MSKYNNLGITLNQSGVYSDVRLPLQSLFTLPSPPHAGLTNASFRWLYTRSETLDGNFQINKLKTKNPLDDVALADGKAFMVKEAEYREHIRITIDDKEVSSL